MKSPICFMAEDFKFFLLNKVDGKLGDKFSAFPIEKLISVLS